MGELPAKVREKVYKRLNEFLGRDLKNLSKCEELSRTLKAQKAELEKTLTLTNDELHTSKVAEAIKYAEDQCSNLSSYCDKIDDLLERIERQTAHNEKYSVSLKEYFDKIGNLELALSYFLILEKVQKISDSIEFCLSVPDLERAVEEYTGLRSLCSKLAESSCIHLHQFLIETTRYWNSLLKKKLSEEFNVAMKNIQWPFVRTNNVTTGAPLPDALSTFQQVIKHLLLVELPEELSEKHVVSSSLVVSFPDISLPVSLLIQPLRKRFLYHFSGSRQTNRIDKPEWYFTQVLTWIRDHEGFVVKWVQPVYNHLKICKSAQVELLSGLVQLAVEKLSSDLEQIQFDDTLFSHTVDEALGFDRELRDVFLYPQSLPAASSVLTQAHIFVKWIRMEKKFARDKMDCMLASETAWSSVCPDDKVTEVGHTYLAILSSMTERYSALLQPGHKLQFVELQIELTEELRMSLIQILHSERADPLNSRLPDILNTVAYLVSSLQEWDASPEMLLLEHYKDHYVDNAANANCDTEGNNNIGRRPSTDGTTGASATGGIFKRSLRLLDRLKDQLVVELSEAVLLEVKARSRPYRRDRWHGMTGDDLISDECLSWSACPMYQVLATKLHSMHQRLAEPLFNRLWQLVTTKLDIFLLEELVLENTFSVPGGKILQRDLNKGLMSLFFQYTHRPQSYFPKMEEACSLLTLPHVPPAIKRAALTGSNHDLFHSLTIPLKHLTNTQIATVLKRRTDLATEVL